MKFISALILMIISAGSLSKTHEILVSSNIFTPNSLTIEAGDTVRWRNTGGSHNVFASDGSFRCAQGCEAEGGDGSPSPVLWTAEVTFRKTGTVNYYCQPHLQFGMQGSITVIEPQSVIVEEIHATVTNEFIPNDITIQRGTAIRFINDGGEHNIHAVDDTLICSQSCEGDGFNTESSATGFPWDIYVKFEDIGEVPYYCETHQPGVSTGIIRVISDTLFQNGFETK